MRDWSVRTLSAGIISRAGARHGRRVGWRVASEGGDVFISVSLFGVPVWLAAVRIGLEPDRGGTPHSHAAQAGARPVPVSGDPQGAIWAAGLTNYGECANPTLTRVCG